MIAFASVDLPDPFGPIRAWMLPFSTSRLTPLRIFLPSAVTCRLRISSSAMAPDSVAVGGLSLRRADRGVLGTWGGRVLIGELDQLGQRGAGEGLRDAALHSGPEKLRRAGLIAVSLMRTRNLALGVGVEALHRRDRALECLYHLEHLDLVRRSSEPVTAVGATLALDEAGLAQLCDQVLEIGEGKSFGLRDRAQ